MSPVGRRARILIVLLAVMAVAGGTASSASAALVRALGTETCPRSPLAPKVPLRCSDLIFDSAGLNQLVQKNIFGYAIAPARLEPRTLSMRFPIKGGLFEDTTMVGKINHLGGMKLVKFSDDPSQTAPVKELDTTNLKVVNGLTLTGNAFGLIPAPTADLVNPTHTKLPGGIVNFEADVHINAVTAAALNVYFETDAFTPGLKLGHWKSTIETRPALGL
jgi:hypothetical protein